MTDDEFYDSCSKEFSRMPLDENCESMNQMILSRREENARKVKQDYNSTLSKYEFAKNILEKATHKFKTLEENASILDHKSTLYTGEIAGLSSTTLEGQKRLIDLECKMDILNGELAHTERVKEKEMKTFQIHQNLIDEKAKENEEFWRNEMKAKGSSMLEERMKVLLCKQESLDKQIKIVSEKIKETNVTKLSEDCMILKKRNAAIHKRLIKRVEALEKQLKNRRNHQNYSGN